MAMLAEPRQKKRYNLTPRGKALYEDDSRYGTKMLEKMGWSKGKGLGAKEDGTKDFIRVRMRNTNEGLGFEDRDDHWTQHEQDFSGLLNTLNGDNDTNEKSVDDGSASGDEMATVGFGFATKPKQVVEKLKAKFSGESLEEKSKRSKARVHYKKFTKGKDLSQYSEKDLANIFGKKVVEEQQSNGIFEQFTAITVQPEAEPEEETESAKEKENFGGVQTISAGLSVNEYFKQKMEALKNKKKQSSTAVEPGETQKANLQNEEELSAHHKKEKKKNKKKRALEDDEPNAVVDIVDPVPKKKKAKKAKEETDENLPIANKSDETYSATSSKVCADLETNGEEKPRKKKNKKDTRTNNPEFVETVAEALEVTIPDDSTIKRKKKKSKNKESADNVLTDEMEVKTSKQKKEELPMMAPLIHKEQISSTSKKSKKRKNQNATECSSSESIIPQMPSGDTQNLPASNEKPRKKSKKDVSGTAEEIANQSVMLDELIAQCNSYNVYTISSFCAEKFRKVALGSFAGATLAQIPGYSYNVGELKLDVKLLPKDEERITALWNCKMNKYQSANPKAIYFKYMVNVRSAYKKKLKTPHFHVKTLKRKNAFQSI